MTKPASDILAEQAAKKAAHTSLQSKKRPPPRTKAQLAGKLTDPDTIARSRSSRYQTAAMTKADKALRKMYEAAKPGECYTLNEIANVMGITRERVRQIEQKAKKNFRNRLTVLLKSEGVTPGDITAVLAAANLET